MNVLVVLKKCIQTYVLTDWSEHKWLKYQSLLSCSSVPEYLDGTMQLVDVKIHVDMFKKKTIFSTFSYLIWLLFSVSPSPKILLFTTFSIF